MIVRRTLDGAWKCALRDFLREELRATPVSIPVEQKKHVGSTLTGVDLGHFGGSGGVVVVGVVGVVGRGCYARCEDELERFALFSLSESKCAAWRCTLRRRVGQTLAANTAAGPPSTLRIRDTRRSSR